MIESFLFLMARVFCSVSDWFLSKAFRAQEKRETKLHPGGFTPADFRDFYQDNPPGTSKQAMAALEQRGMEGVHLYDLPTSAQRLFVREGKVVLAPVADPTWGAPVKDHRVCYSGDDFMEAAADSTWGTK